MRKRIIVSVISLASLLVLAAVLVFSWAQVSQAQARGQAPNPAAGEYWVLVQNWLTGQVLDDIDLTIATVPGTDNGNLKATGPAGAIPAGTLFDLTLAWNEPSLAVGESWFALVEFGSDRTHPTNAGSALVKLTRVSG